MKFEQGDKSYLEKRKIISKKYGDRELWSVIDQWPLYAGISNLARNIAISDFLRETINIPGHIAEFGSWRGANLMLLAKLLRILDPLSCKLVYGFEGFEGLSDFDNKDYQAVVQSGAYKGSYEELADLIDLYDLQSEIIIEKGNILETLPKLLEAEQALSFSFVYCDTDLYSTTKLILDRLHERLSIGGIFLFDQWNYSKWPGESVAVREFLSEQGKNYEMLHVRNSRQPSLVLRKK